MTVASHQSARRRCGSGICLDPQDGCPRRQEPPRPPGEAPPRGERREASLCSSRGDGARSHAVCRRRTACRQSSPQRGPKAKALPSPSASRLGFLATAPGGAGGLMGPAEDAAASSAGTPRRRRPSGNPNRRLASQPSGITSVSVKVTIPPIIGRIVGSTARSLTSLSMTISTIGLSCGRPMSPLR